MNKKGFEFSFAWIFAIVIGAIIIFLAIYATMRFVDTRKYQLNTVTAKQLSIIFEPMETGLASAKSTKVELREETKIYNDCFTSGGFGSHRFSLSSKSGIGSKWSDKGGDIKITNKYIFSQDVEQGKTVYFFSKPLELPWKVSELIFLSTSQYCFKNAPDFVESEVFGLNLQNVRINNCTGDEINVCFDSSGCDIIVRGTCTDFQCENKYEQGIIEKEGKTLKYAGSLMYAGIFSSSEIYECNVNRLMKRLMQQALIFRDESNFLSVKCGALSSLSFLRIINLAKIDNPDIWIIRNEAKQLDNENENAECQLW